MIAALQSCARAMLGAGPEVCVDLIEALQGPLWPGEAEQIDRAVDRRRRDFVAGRTAARRALADLGHPPVTLLRGVGGAVWWPPGITGSLSHCDDLCIAVVARTDAVRSVGIDLERMQFLDPAMRSVICTSTEIAALARVLDIDLQTIRIFSAKEAVFKAQYPISGALIDFHGVEIDLADDGFAATLTAGIGPFHAGQVLTGRQTTVQGHVLSSVMIRT